MFNWLTKKKKNQTSRSNFRDETTNYSGAFQFGYQYSQEDMVRSFDIDWFYDNPQLYYKIMHKLVIGSPTVGQAMSSMVNHSNSGHTIHYDIGERMNERLITLLRQETQDVLKSISGSSSINSFINRIIRFVDVYGTISGEMITDQYQTRVMKYIFVPPYQYAWDWDNINLEWYKYYLNRSGEKVKVDDYNFVYIPLIQFIRPEAIPPFITALQPVFVQNKFNMSMASIADYYGLLGILIVTLYDVDTKRRKNDDGSIETVEQFAQRKMDAWRKDSELFRKESKKALILRKVSAPTGNTNTPTEKYTVSDLQKIDHIPVPSNLKGTNEFVEINRKQLLDAIDVSEIFLGNIPQNVNRSFGEVIAKKDNIKVKTRQELNSDFIRKVLMFHFQLRRLPVYDVKVEWNESHIASDIDKWTAEKLKEEAKKLKIENDTNLKEKGLLNDIEYNERLKGYLKKKNNIEYNERLKSYLKKKTNIITMSFDKSNNKYGEPDLYQKSIIY